MYIDSAMRATHLFSRTFFEIKAFSVQSSISFNHLPFYITILTCVLQITTLFQTTRPNIHIECNQYK